MARKSIDKRVLWARFCQNGQPDEPETVWAKITAGYGGGDQAVAVAERGRCRQRVQLGQRVQLEVP